MIENVITCFLVYLFHNVLFVFYVHVPYSTILSQAICPPALRTGTWLFLLDLPASQKGGYFVITFQVFVGIYLYSTITWKLFNRN